MSGFDLGLRERPDEIDPETRLKLESRNSINLSEEGMSYLADHFQVPLRFDPELLLSLNAIAVREIQPDAGMFRREQILVRDHIPPKAADVPTLIDEMLDHANGQIDDFYTAAFILWRVCWIHPFSDGNGRVARMLSYISLSILLREVIDLGGFFSQIMQREDEYYAALADADKRWAASDQDYQDPNVVRDMEQLLLDIYAVLQQHPSG